MIRLLCMVAVVISSNPAAAADIPTEVKAKLQSAMISHVDGVMVLTRIWTRPPTRLKPFILQMFIQWLFLREVTISSALK